MGGLLHYDKHNDEYIDWIKHSIQVGDTITIRVVETSNSTQPIRRRRQNPKLVEKAQRKYYESLKKEYQELE